MYLLTRMRQSFPQLGFVFGILAKTNQSELYFDIKYKKCKEKHFPMPCNASIRMSKPKLVMTMISDLFPWHSSHLPPYQIWITTTPIMTIQMTSWFHWTGIRLGRRVTPNKQHRNIRGSLLYAGHHDRNPHFSIAWQFVFRDTYSPCEGVQLQFIIDDNGLLVQTVQYPPNIVLPHNLRKMDIHANHQDKLTSHNGGLKLYCRCQISRN